MTKLISVIIFIITYYLLSYLEKHINLNVLLETRLKRGIFLLCSCVFMFLILVMRPFFKPNYFYLVFFIILFKIIYSFFYHLHCIQIDKKLPKPNEPKIFKYFDMCLKPTMYASLSTGFIYAIFDIGVNSFKSVTGRVGTAIFFMVILSHALEFFKIYLETLGGNHIFKNLNIMEKIKLYTKLFIGFMKEGYKLKNISFIVYIGYYYIFLAVLLIITYTYNSTR